MAAAASWSHGMSRRRGDVAVGVAVGVSVGVPVGVAVVNLVALVRVRHPLPRYWKLLRSVGACRSSRPLRIDFAGWHPDHLGGPPGTLGGLLVLQLPGQEGELPLHHRAQLPHLGLRGGVGAVPGRLGLLLVAVDECAVVVPTIVAVVAVVAKDVPVLAVDVGLLAVDLLAVDVGLWRCLLAIDVHHLLSVAARLLDERRVRLARDGSAELFQLVPRGNRRDVGLQVQALGQLAELLGAGDVAGVGLLLQLLLELPHLGDGRDQPSVHLAVHLGRELLELRVHLARVRLPLHGRLQSLHLGLRGGVFDVGLLLHRRVELAMLRHRGDLVAVRLEVQLGRDRLKPGDIRGARQALQLGGQAVDLYGGGLERDGGHDLLHLALCGLLLLVHLLLELRQQVLQVVLQGGRVGARGHGRGQLLQLGADGVLSLLAVLDHWCDVLVEVVRTDASEEDYIEGSHGCGKVCPSRAGE
mmetsp:Transcript_65916/g.172731  ORF Transcript_65916/g.172731 Transcript_65916/m.172731 type:complete len:470 (+) Transcript_65916:322-1731(+)